MRIPKKLLACAAALLIGTASAATLDLAGVKVEDNATVGNTQIPLNGAGIRFKIFKIYVGALYAPKKVSSLDELLATPGAKRMQMTFVREVDSAAFGKLLTRGVEDNVPKSELPKLVPGLMKMSSIFANIKSMQPGDVITMDWIPGTGLVIHHKGNQQGEPFTEPAFFRAMMSLWLGPAPGDWKLKDALLNIKN